ncbi:unnamed protein product [Amaranthus hypochondriacus]
MCTVSVSASVPAFRPSDCSDSICPSTPVQNAVLFAGLYLIALGSGGIKPCISSFGADQFDDTDPIERVKKGSYFNWFYLSINIGSLVSSTLIVWLQENVGWEVGFVTPTIFMGIAIASFFFGTPVYRFKKPGGSPLTRVIQVIVASVQKRKLEVPEDRSLLYETPDKLSVIGGSRKLEHTENLWCLDKAAVLSDSDVKNGNFSNNWRLCTVTQVEELKLLIRMVPIWATAIVFFAVFAQMMTLFIEQGMVMDRRVRSFTIPAASLSTFDVINVIIWVPIYDKFLVPAARKFTNKERGFSNLQRMGIGLFISIFGMVSAALVELRRLQVAEELGLIDQHVPVPFSVLWQIPQFTLMGVAEVFTIIGILEFFYEQSPDAMRSLCSALALVSIALGNYLSSLILTIVTAITTAGGKPGWIPDNLNNGRLYNFFWLMAGLGFLNLLLYILFAMKYRPKNAS